MRELVLDATSLAVTEPVVGELLAGARDEAHQQELELLLSQLPLLLVDHASDYHAAADVYRRCRHSGFTPRGLLDCLVAAVALRHGADLLARDIDLERIAAVTGIRLDRS